jgi:pilus assembly protein CpaB
MNRRLLLIIAFSMLVGLAASFLVFRVVTQVQGARDQDTDAIVVAAANLGLAETITGQNVRLVRWPRRSIPPGVVKTLADAEGRVVRSSIVAGEPLLEAKLAPQLSGKAGIMPMLVPDGQRGVTFRVPDAVRETGFILPNSRVDVLVSMPKPGGNDRIAKVILQDVLILAAGQAVEMRDNKPVSVTTVTVALDPEQTERLALAQSEGRLMLATRNLKDNKIVPTKGATVGSLLADTTSKPAPVADPGPRPTPKTKAEVLPPPKVDTTTVSVLRGGKATEHVFVRDGGGWTDQGQPKR